MRDIPFHGYIRSRPMLSSIISLDREHATVNKSTKFKKLAASARCYWKIDDVHVWDVQRVWCLFFWRKATHVSVGWEIYSEKRQYIHLFLLLFPSFSHLNLVIFSKSTKQDIRDRNRNHAPATFSFSEGYGYQLQVLRNRKTLVQHHSVRPKGMGVCGENYHVSCKDFFCDAVVYAFWW